MEQTTHCFRVGRYSIEQAAFQGVVLGCGLRGLFEVLGAFGF